MELSFFSSQVLTYLGSIESDSDTLVSDISSILTYFITLCDQTDQLETYLYNIYQVIDGTAHTSSGSVSVQTYRNLYTMLYAYVAGFTGLGRSTSSLTPESISTATYNRWIQIIGDAIESKLNLANSNSAAVMTQYENDVDAVQNIGQANNTFEDQVWSDVSSRLDRIGLDATSSTVTLPAAVWFTSAVEYVWGRLGIFAFVISVTIVGGWVTIILGRINKYGSTFRDD